jgi:hypothetical protein
MLTTGQTSRRDSSANRSGKLSYVTGKKALEHALGKRSAPGYKTHHIFSDL